MTFNEMFTKLSQLRVDYSNNPTKELRAEISKLSFDMLKLKRQEGS